MVVANGCSMRAGETVCVGSEWVVAVPATQPELFVHVNLKSHGFRNADSILS
jgi:hypothetical protein